MVYKTLLFIISVLNVTNIFASRGGGGGGWSSSGSSGSGGFGSGGFSRHSSWGAHGGGSGIGGLEYSDWMGILLLFSILGMILPFIVGFFIKVFKKNSEKSKNSFDFCKKIAVFSFFILVLLIILSIDIVLFISFALPIVVLFFQTIIGFRSSLVTFRFGFYLSDGSLIEEIKSTIKKCKPDSRRSLLYMFKKIIDIVYSNRDYIRLSSIETNIYKNSDKLKEFFEKKVVEERTKYEKEEFLNVDGRSYEDKSTSNLEEIFILTIIVGYLDSFKINNNTLDSIISYLTFFKNKDTKKIAGVSVWYNIMDRDEIIEKYPDIKVV